MSGVSLQGFNRGYLDLTKHFMAKLGKVTAGGDEEINFRQTRWMLLNNISVMISTQISVEGSI